jgi:hypothetical protein
MRSFMAVTYHFVNSEFELESGLLDFVRVNGKHNGSRLAASLIYVFNKFELTKSQVVTITVDNASNNDTMVENLIQKGYLESGEHHIRCFAHILNLCAQDLLKLISSLITQLRTNNKFIRGSSPRLDVFEKLCPVNGEKFVKPQLDCPTRWNSTYHMLISNLKLRKSIGDFILRQENLTFEEEVQDELGVVKVSVLKARSIPVQEWDNVETIVDILEPIEEASKGMCAEKIPTLSLMMPYFDSILDMLQEKEFQFRRIGRKDEDADTIADGASAAYEKLLKYFNISSELAIVATVLDARFKMEYYSMNPENKEVLTQQVRKLYDGSDEVFLSLIV